MKEIQIVYKSWDEVPLSVYYDIVNITEDSSLKDIEKNIYLAAILSETDVKDIYKLKMSELNSLLNQLEWTKTFTFNKEFHAKHLKINDKRYDVKVHLNTFNIAQYVDFQTFWSMPESQDKLVNILSVFLVPHGKEYNEGYDIEEVKREIFYNLPITTSQAILHFFCQQSVLLTKAMLIYCNWMMKKIQKSKKTKLSPELIQKIQQMQESLKVHLATFGSV